MTALFVVILIAGFLLAAWASSAATDPPVTVTTTTTVESHYWHKRFLRMKLYARGQEIARGKLLKRVSYLMRRLARLVGGGSFSSAQASWYGPGFYGQGTACGQTLTTSSNWVAHKTLACGTRLVICAARCALTSVQDRGPYVAGRDFDLAPGLKSAIGFGSTGTVRWRLA